jgi:hypothetical protein
LIIKILILAGIFLIVVQTLESSIEKLTGAGITMAGAKPKKETPEQRLVRIRENVMRKYGPTIIEAAKQHSVNPMLVATIIAQESAGNPNAVSRAGAKGLMQLMPGTARGLGVKDSSDPIQNIFAGTKYIATQLKNNKGDVALALASYNAGPGNVRKYKGVPPFKETQSYVKHITAALGINAPQQNYEAPKVAVSSYQPERSANTATLSSVGDGRLPISMMMEQEEEEPQMAEIPREVAQAAAPKIVKDTDVPETYADTHFARAIQRMRGFM